MIAWNNLYYVVEVKPTLGQNGPKPGQNFAFLPFSQV